MSGPRLSLVDFEFVADALGAHFGLSFGPETRASLERRLMPRVAARMEASVADYVSFLRFATATDPEWYELAHAVTIHETYFFREREQLASFSEELLPELAERLQSSRKLTIWSAGCSTGEEAYTLAILVLQSGLFDGWNVHVYGTDLSRACVQYARKGRYGPSSLRGASALDYAGYLVRDGEEYEVAPSARKMCHFGASNLAGPEAALFFGEVDVVFCRNVLIYLTEHAKTRLVSRIYERLAPGGVLFLGHAESLLHLSTSFDLLHLRRDLAYTKRRPLLVSPGA